MHLTIGKDNNYNIQSGLEETTALVVRETGVSRRIFGPIEEFPETPQFNSAAMVRWVSEGTVNSSPMMPRNVSLSKSCTSDR